MERVYGTMTSYVDHGEDTTVSRGRRGDRRFDGQFDIAFVRGGVLRVEYRSTARSYVVWWDGNEALTLTDDHPNLIVKMTVERAINEPRGVLPPVVAKVVGMLLPDVVGPSWWSSLADLRLLGAERIMNRDCWKLEGEYGGDSKVTFWVDQETFLLRRADERNRIELSRMSMLAGDSTATFNPTVDGLVDSALLQPPVARTL